MSIIGSTVLACSFILALIFIRGGLIGISQGLAIKPDRQAYVVGWWLFGIGFVWMTANIMCVLFFTVPAMSGLLH